MREDPEELGLGTRLHSIPSSSLESHIRVQANLKIDEDFVSCAVFENPAAKNYSLLISNSMYLSCTYHFTNFNDKCQTKICHQMAAYPRFLCKNESKVYKS